MEEVRRLSEHPGIDLRRSPGKLGHITDQQLCARSTTEAFDTVQPAKCFDGAGVALETDSGEGGDHRTHHYP